MDMATPPTQDTIQQRRKLAQALMQQGTDTSPVGHWTQAAARVAQALAGGYYGNEATKAATQREAYDLKQAEAKRNEARGYAEGAMQREVQQRAGLAQQYGFKPGTQQFQQFVLTGKLPDPNADLDRRYKEAQIQALQQKGVTDNKRLEMLQKLNIEPESAEGIAFLANGKLPAATIQQRVQQERRAATSPNIAAGLQNLNKMADDYDDASFSNAVGPFQGATPSDDGMLTASFANIARGFGEVANMVEGGKTAPSEVRSNIIGATETLAAAIKPLIRAPGEGVWTDQDQARLVSIVGDLAQARDKQEYRRRLNAVRDRIKSNFNLDIQFDALTQAKRPQQQSQQAGDALQQAREAIANGADRNAVMQRLQQSGINPAGL